MTVLCAARLYRVKDLVFMLPSAPVKGGGLWLVVVVLCELLLVFPHLSSAFSAATPNNSVSYAVSWLGKNSHDFEDVTYGDSIRQRTTVELWSSCNCDPWGAALPDSKLYILPTMTKWPLMTYKPLSEFVIIRIILISQFRTRFHLEQLIWLNNRSCQSYALALCVYHIFFSCYTSPVSFIADTSGGGIQHYADDTQYMYRSLWHADMHARQSQLSHCFSALHSWFCDNGLAVNSLSTTEYSSKSLHLPIRP